MKLHVTYIDTFQYHGPYSIEMQLGEKQAIPIQSAATKAELREALDSFLSGDEFLKHMTAEWKHPVLTEEECGTCCDKDPQELLYTMRSWFKRSIAYTSVRVLRATKDTPYDITVFTMHEEMADGFEDQFLHIAIDHDLTANVNLKQEYLVPTVEERQAQREQDAYADSLWDD